MADQANTRPIDGRRQDIAVERFDETAKIVTPIRVGLVAPRRHVAERLLGSAQCTASAAATGVSVIRRDDEIAGIGERVHEKRALGAASVETMGKHEER